MEPNIPAVYPSSGMYRPPLAVTITCQLSDGDILYYALDNDRGSSRSKRERYVAPFLIPEAGRFRVTAFVWRQGFGEGPHATALFMLDDSAPPATIHRQNPSIFQSSLAAPTTAYRADRGIKQLRFSRSPREIRSLEPFDVEVTLFDAEGFPSSGEFSSAAKLVITGEVSGSASVAKTLLDLPHRKAQGKAKLVPFVETAMMICEHDAQDGSRLARSGRGGSWNSYANSEPCLGIASSSAFGGISFAVSSLCRVIVGIHAGLDEASSELSWKCLPFSFHFSADLADPTTVPAFRLYEMGKLVEEAGTVEFCINDSFEFVIRPNGDVSYLHNGCTIHTSKSPNPQLLYCVHTRIAAQLDSTAIQKLKLTENGNVFVAEGCGVVWKPPMEPDVELTAKFLILRAWISGEDVLPATTKVPIATNCIPRWAFAALSLGSMFALGAVGCQSSQISPLMTDQHAHAPELTQFWRGPPPLSDGLPTTMQSKLPATPSKIPEGTDYPGSPVVNLRQVIRR